MATSSATSATSHARALVVAFLVVVAAFLISTTYTDQVIDSLRRQTASMRTTVLSSIEVLSDVRSDLRHVEVGVEHEMDVRTEHLVDPKAEPSEAAVPLADSKQRLRTNAHAYLAQPAFEGQQRLATEVEDELAHLESMIVRAEQIAPDATTAQRLAQERELHETVDHTEDALVHLIRFIAQRGHRLTDEMDTVREHARLFAYLCDLVATIIALAAGVVALRTFRRHEALVVEHDRTLEARALELEGFAARVAHDIKGPLAAALLSLELVEATSEAGSSTRKTAARGRNALLRGNRVVDAMLDFARAGIAPTMPSSTRVHATLDALVDEARTRAAAKGFRIEVQPFDDVELACGEGVLISAVGNLLDNALRYTADSVVREIQIRVMPHGDLVRVEVDDTGPGFRESPDVLFLPHVRGARAIGDGIGLGLATVKRLVEAHHGHVGARTKEAGGSVFWFELPRKPA